MRVSRAESEKVIYLWISPLSKTVSLQSRMHVAGSELQICSMVFSSLLEMQATYL